MVRVCYESPNNKFKYKIPKRVNKLSTPKRYYVPTGSDMPPVTPIGLVRQSALTGYVFDKNNDIAWPWLRRLVHLKRAYRNRFSAERLERVDRMIEAANATIYSKLANCSVDLKKQDIKDIRGKRKGWSETEWKRHMEYIGQIAAPKKVFSPPPIKRGKSKPLDALMPRIMAISSRPDFKCYKRLSQESWYRNPEKVASNALKYHITERIQHLAVARAIHEPKQIEYD